MPAENNNKPKKISKQAIDSYRAKQPTSQYRMGNEMTSAVRDWRGGGGRVRRSTRLYESNSKTLERRMSFFAYLLVILFAHFLKILTPGYLSSGHHAMLADHSFSKSVTAP